MIGYAVDVAKPASVISLTALSFLVFPASFPNNPSEWPKSSSAAIIAGVFLTIGYISAAALTLLRRSWLFQMDVIFV